MVNLQVADGEDSPRYGG